MASSCFSGSSFPSSQPTALEVLPLAPDASGMPLNHICNILGAKLNHCLTEIILQTSGKAKAASACNQGAGRTGGAGCNCLSKPVRDPHFLTEGTGAEAMWLHSSQWGMRRSGNAWRLDRSTRPLHLLSSAEPSMMTHSQHREATVLAHTALLQPACIEECDHLLHLGHRVGISHFSRLPCALPAISNGLIVCLQADII